MTSAEIKSTAAAEVISVVLKTKTNHKFCVSTVYRVGTLGEENLSEIRSHLDKISKSKTVHKHVLVGDFNLNEVTWPVVRK